MQARTIERCEVTWEMLLLVTIQSAMQLVKLLVQLLVNLRAPNEMQSRGIWMINEARSKDNRTIITEMHKPLGKHTAERGLVKGMSRMKERIQMTVGLSTTYARMSRPPRGVRFRSDLLQCVQHCSPRAVCKLTGKIR